MRVTLYTFLLVFTALGCLGQNRNILSKGESAEGNITLIVRNETGFDIDSVILFNKQIGFVKKDTSFTLFNCKGLGEQSGAGYFFVHRGVIQSNKPKCYMPYYGCGTGMEAITKGKFELNITYYETDDCHGITFNLSTLETTMFEANDALYKIPIKCRESLMHEPVLLRSQEEAKQYFSQTIACPIDSFPSNFFYENLVLWVAKAGKIRKEEHVIYRMPEQKKYVFLVKFYYKNKESAQLLRYHPMADLIPKIEKGYTVEFKTIDIIKNN